MSNLEEEDLSLILTSQNPARIDVRTLRKKKVIIIPTCWSLTSGQPLLYGNKNIHTIEIIFSFSKIMKGNTGTTFLSAKHQNVETTVSGVIDSWLVAYLHLSARA